MSGFWIGLAIGIVVTIMVFSLMYFLSRRGMLRLTGKSGEGLYRKILVASIDRPFSERSLLTAVMSQARKGYVETLYVLEISLDHPLDVPPEAELDKGMKALDMAARFGIRHGTRFIPRLEKVRMGSKAILDLQRKEGFDLLVMDTGRGEANDKDVRKIAEYVRENASCTVIILSRGEGPSRK